MVYKEQTDSLISFGLDDNQNKLLMISKSKMLRPDERIFKILNITDQKIVFKKIITNIEFIGRLESGLYTFVDGHIYYNNNVIKIRYDLIFKADS